MRTAELLAPERYTSPTPDIPLEYRTTQPIDLYDSPACVRLATQVARNRHLRLLPSEGQAPNSTAIAVCVCEDDYPAWLNPLDLKWLQVASKPYEFRAVAVTEIEAKLTNVIQFGLAAQSEPNIYLWGGTLGPNYDCSGLMQAAFASIGVWLPRDAYQQEDFLEPLDFDALRPGDLVFFGTPQKATHVGLYLGEGRYLHSSGLQGRNGIGIDSLVELSDPISQSYYQQLRGYGRVVASYESTGLPYVLKRTPPPSS